MQGFTPFIFVASVDCDGIKKGIADYICDGVADQVQIQAAIDGLAAYPNGGSVVLSAGNFYISAPIKLRNFLKISGQSVGATRLQLTASCDMFVHDGAVARTFAVMEDMYLDGESQLYSGRAIVSNANLWDLYISRLNIMYFTGDAVITDEAWGWEINDTVIEYCKCNGFVLNANHSGPKITNCKIEENYKHGILIRSGGGLQVVNTQLRGTAAENGTKVYAKLTTGKNLYTPVAWAEGDVVRNATGAGDNWTGTVFDLYLGDHMTNAQVIVQLTTGTYAAIDIADGIENTTKADSTTLSAKSEYRYAGACLEGDAGQNTIMACRMGTLQANAEGIRLDSRYNTIIGNEIYGGYIGIETIISQGLYNTIIGNYLKDQSSKAIYDNAGWNYFANNANYITECSKIITFLYRAAWTTPTAYAASDVVIGDGADADRLWICPAGKAHTSGVWVDDKAAGKWVDLSGTASTVTISLTHTLNIWQPKYSERIFQITPASLRMATDIWYVSSVTATKVVITFGAALINAAPYSFIVRGFYQTYTYNLTAP